MASQWFVPVGGIFPMVSVMIDEDGTDEFFIPGIGMINEDQAAIKQLIRGFTRNVGRLMNP